MVCRMRLCRILQSVQHTQGETKEREILKNPTKNEDIQGKKKLLTEIEPLQLAF